MDADKDVFDEDSEICTQGSTETMADLRKENDALRRKNEELQDSISMREGFTPNCPIHRSIRLPDITKRFVDTRLFQRLRFVKQLGMCYFVYPGAVHDRFFHSIGTAWLAYSFIKDIKTRHAELSISRIDILCVTLAGLLHDIGHPCFSHTFERFMHLNGCPDWKHEDASIALCDVLFEELKDVLQEEGFVQRDLVFIKELINPPAAAMHAALREAPTSLVDKWNSLIRGRPVEYAWMFEIVSNWRSGIDVDKFDYFRRDAHYLGIHREFEHRRYFDNAKVMRDSLHGDITTISPSDKDKDCIQENMFETRKELHRCAYQHKTVKKLEMHMVDILNALNGEMEKMPGVKSLFQRAMNIKEDPASYAMLTDSYIHTKICEASFVVQDAYNKYFVRRELMRMVAVFEVVPDVHVPTLNASDIQEEVLAIYNELKPQFNGKYSLLLKDRKEEDVVVTKHSLRCEVVKIHYGMKDIDPLTSVLFHNKDNSCAFLQNWGRPLQQKLYLFWCPPTDWTKDGDQDVVVRRLYIAFEKWLHADGTSNSEILAQQRVEESHPKRRRLEIKGSCPASMDSLDLSCPASPSLSAYSASPSVNNGQTPRSPSKTLTPRKTISPQLHDCQGRSLKRRLNSNDMT